MIWVKRVAHLASREMHLRFGQRKRRCGEGDGEDGTVLLATARKKYVLILMSGSGGPVDDDGRLLQFVA